MTTTDSPSKFRYQGNGSTDTFAFTGRIFSAEDLVVEIILRADDSLVDTLTLTTDYSVTINGASSASVVVTAPNIPSSLQDIQIRRDLDKAQSLVLPTGTVFPAKSVETALDKTTAMIQELQEQIDRKVGIPVTDSETVPDLTSIVDDAEAAQTAAEAAQTAAEAAQTGAEAAQAAAEAAAAGVSLPPLGAANTVLQVNAGGTALEYGTVDTANIADDAVTNDKIADAELLALAGLTSAANKLPRFTGAGTADLLDFIDDDTMATASATSVPSSESVVAYVGTLFTNLGLSEYFESAELTITANSSSTAAHGLSAAPKLIATVLRCKTAEDGYSIGDEVHLDSVSVGTGSSTATYGIHVAADATDVRVSYGLNGIRMNSKGGGGYNTITNANWRAVVRAWA